MAELARQYRGQIQLLSGLVALAGLWLLISAFVIQPLPEGAMWNNVIVGILVGAMALIRAFGAFDAAWLSWANVVLGFWVLISPWVMGFSHLPEPLWNNVITGIIIVGLAAWSASVTHAAERRGRPMP